MNKIEEEDWTAKLIKIKNKIWWYSRGRWEDDDTVYLVLNQPIDLALNQLQPDAVSLGFTIGLTTATSSSPRLPPGEPSYIFNCFFGGEAFVLALKLSEIEIMGEQ